MDIILGAQRAIRIVRRALRNFSEDEVMSKSAALSYYTLLSFAPLIVLGVWVSSTLAPGTQEIMLGQIAAVAGEDAREAARVVIASAEQRPSLGSIAGLVGVLVLAVGATTVFAQLQASLNRIWGIEAKPSNALLGWLRQRILSIGVIAAIVFVLIVSLLVSTALGLFLTRSGPLWDVLNQLLSTLVFAGLFTLLFRYLPDAYLPWQRAARGGLLTAILFGVGKWLIGLYLARGEVGGAYGAAGSLVVLLVWVYYSSAIFFFSAEVVQAWLMENGETIEPAAHAVSAGSR